MLSSERRPAGRNPDYRWRYASCAGEFYGRRKESFLRLASLYAEGFEFVGSSAKSQEKGPARTSSPISKDNRRRVRTISRSYKGVTDLVTKWLWPIPAFWTVRVCVRFGIRPNHVTLLSLVFAVLAGVAFWHGHYGIGLVMGWLMTFMDTVDGKLARVTVTSSRFGDVLDHGLDIIHPPLWYIAWGVGLDSSINADTTCR